MKPIPLQHSGKQSEFTGGGIYEKKMRYSFLLAIDESRIYKITL